LLIIAIFSAQFAPLTALASSAETLPPQNLSPLKQNIPQQSTQQRNLENAALPPDAQAILDALCSSSSRASSQSKLSYRGEL
jgi:hypothetical protein